MKQLISEQPASFLSAFTKDMFVIIISNNCHHKGWRYSLLLSGHYALSDLALDASGCLWTTKKSKDDIRSPKFEKKMNLCQIMELYSQCSMQTSYLGYLSKGEM